MKFRVLQLLPLLAALAIAGCGDSDSPDSGSTTPAVTATPSPTPTPIPAQIALELHLLGQLDVPGAADIWARGEVAYVGGRCGADGVSIVDASDPASPQLVATAAEHLNTSAEDVMVIDAQTAFFEGELMAVGLQPCPPDSAPQGMKGLELWDVNDPSAPELLGFFDVGPLPQGGVHELYLFQRDDRAFVLAAVPYSEAYHPEQFGDLRIIEVTDPRNPVQVGAWGAGKDGGLPFGSPPDDEDPPDPRSDCTPTNSDEPLCRGDVPWVIAHSASANQDGTRAYVSYWDAGMIILDITDPAQPVMVGRGVEPANHEGNTHSAISVPGDGFAITTDEDFVHLPEDSESATPRPDDFWGLVRIWDITDSTQPTEIATFRTPNSATNRTDGLFTVHNPEVHGDLLFLSWYTDGLRVVDISNPEAPEEVASFVPPFIEDSDGEIMPPYVWGVHVEDNLIFLSDMVGGLFILEMTSEN